MFRINAEIIPSIGNRRSGAFLVEKTSRGIKTRHVIAAAYCDIGLAHIARSKILILPISYIIAVSWNSRLRRIQIINWFVYPITRIVRITPGNQASSISLGILIKLLWTKQIKSLIDILNAVIST